MANLAMNRDQLLRLIIRESLYEACPELADLKDLVLDSYMRYLPVSSCCGNNVSMMFSALDAIMQRLHDERAVGNTDLFRRLKEHICQQKNCVYKRIVIYYRKSSRGLPDKIIL